METPEVALRQATPADAATLALLGGATFLETYAGWLPGSAILEACLQNHTAEAWTAILGQPGTTTWLATVAPEAAPIGYASLLPEPHLPGELVRPGDCELKRIYLFSRFHGTGTGQRLMAESIANARQSGARRILLGTHQDNARAIRFYQRNGFREIGRREFQVGCCQFDDPVLALEL